MDDDKPQPATESNAANEAVAEARELEDQELDEATGGLVSGTGGGYRPPR